MENPLALGLLHGQEFNKPKVVEMWQRVAAELEDRHPNVQFVFGFAPAGWGFYHGQHGPEVQPIFNGLVNDEEPEFNSIFILPKTSELMPDIQI